MVCSANISILLPQRKLPVVDCTVVVTVVVVVVGTVVVVVVVVFVGTLVVVVAPVALLSTPTADFEKDYVLRSYSHLSASDKC